MRPDSIKKEEAVLAVQSADPKYLVIGFKSDGIRGIPYTYTMVMQPANTQEGVLQIISTLTPPFRVFKVSDVGCLSWEAWVEKEKAESTSKTESEERELLQKLKDKYENK